MENNSIFFLRRDGQPDVKIYEDSLRKNDAMHQRFLLSQFTTQKIADCVRSELLRILRQAQKGSTVSMYVEEIGEIQVWVGHEIDFLPDFDHYKNIAQPR